jgi:hypothetical protein
VELSGELFQMPELLRVKGRVLCALPAPRLDEAEQSIRAAFDLAGAQHSRSWQLRAAMDLASLVAGRRKAGMQLLNDVFAQYTEGFDTTDVKAAARLLMAQNSKD